MHDLFDLYNAGKFNLDPAAPTRLALLHRSFRSVSLARGVQRQQFAAHFPGLGLLNLALGIRVGAAAGRTPLPEIRYFDEAAYADETALAGAMSDWLAPSARPMIAATAYTSTVDRLEGFFERFDSCRHLVVVGGPHATVAPEIANAHIVVRGEGGAAMEHILRAVGTPAFGDGPDGNGLCFVFKGVAVMRKQVFDRSLAAMPAPCYAYDLLPDSCESPIYATNFTRMLGDRPQIYVCTQSCKARCTFCSTYLIHGRPVARPLDLIRADLHYLVKECGYDSLEFHDDDLAQHPEFEGLLQVLADLGVPWFCYMRTDVMSPQRARDMAASGCRRVFLGVESLSQSKLDYFRKDVSVQDNIRAVEALAAAGIGTVAGFIIGCPDETAEDIVAESHRFLKLPLYSINCSILSPDPGTVEFLKARKRSELFRAQMATKSSARIVPDFEKFGSGMPIGLPTVCEAVSKADLNRLLSVIDGAFYFRPHVWECMTANRSPSQVDCIRRYFSFVAAAVDKEANDNYDGVDPRIRNFRNEVFEVMRAPLWDRLGVRAPSAVFDHAKSL